MTTALHLATPEDAPILFDLMARFASEHALTKGAEDRQSAVAPLLEGHPYGMAYLLGPRRAPVGYLIITLGWSLDLGGTEAIVSELFLRDAVRGRGISTEVLIAIAKSLKSSGIKALHVDIQSQDAVEQAAIGKAGFTSAPIPPRWSRIL